MAAELDISVVVDITGLADPETHIVKKFTSSTTPAERAEQVVSCGTTATSLDLGNIAAGSGYLLWLFAVTGNFYIKLGATTGTPSAADSHLYIPEGEGYAIPITPNATSVAGVRFVGDSANSKLEYLLVGS